MRLAELIELLRTATDMLQLENVNEEIFEIIPELKKSLNYNQNNHAHQYDLLRHQYQTALNLPRDMDDAMLYLAALIHDVGKPYTRSVDYKDGKLNCHYFGHQVKSEEITVEKILPYMEYIGEEITDSDKFLLTYYVRHHDDHVNFKIKYLRRHLEFISIEQFRHLMELEVADAKAHVLIPVIEERIAVCSRLASEEVYVLMDSLSQMPQDRKKQK